MLGDAAAMAAVLAGTRLRGREVVPVPRLPGFTIDCHGNEVLEAWQAARSVVDQTGSWPVVTTETWVPRVPPNWPPQYTVTPLPDPLAGLQLPEVATVVAALVDRYEPEPDCWDWSVESELATTARDFGRSPSREDVANALGGRRSEVALNRLLLDWELARQAEGAPAPTAHDDYMLWFAFGDAVLAFSPAQSSWETLAYFPFYEGGGSTGRLEWLLALVRSWAERFGAELVANWGTMLQFVVARPPTTIEAAWQLAVEQHVAARCTTLLPGIPLRRHAQILVGRTTWFLHERP